MEARDDKPLFSYVASAGLLFAALGLYVLGYYQLSITGTDKHIRYFPHQMLASAYRPLAFVEAKLMGNGARVGWRDDEYSYLYYQD